jgi:signal transduction histidine kinase
MSARNAPRIAWTAAALSAVLGIGGFVLDRVAGLGMSAPLSSAYPMVWALSLSLIGALVVSRQPRNALGWVFTLVGLLITFNYAGSVYAAFTRTAGGGSWPAGLAIAWLTGGWLWIPISALLVIFVPLLFPNGRALSRRWRFPAWFGTGYIVLAGIGNALMPGPLSSIPRASNPMGLVGKAALLTSLENLSVVPLLIAVVGAVASLVVRFRRARGQERQQLKWFLYGGVLFMVPFLMHGSGIPQQIQDWALALFIPALPISIAIAMLKYRLYDIDLVINKSLVFGALAVFITAVYVGIVVGVGALVGGTGRSNLGLSILATAIVAVAFQPVRERVQRIANRLVYGKRATPYEVMADFSERMAGAISADEVLPKMAEAAARGVGANASRIRLLLPNGSERVVSWPVALEADHFDRVLPVAYQGDAMGEIAVAKAAGEPITPAEDKLLTDLAAQAGLVMHNVRLTVELEGRLAEISAQAAQLRTSRQRIVAAQDEERRRLEETIRRGSEVQLVRIRQALTSAEQGLASDPVAAVVTLEQLIAQATAVLEELREVARGVYPPVLESDGLAAALRTHIGRVSASVAIDSDAIDRYPSEIEAAIYFCCIEALQGVTEPAAIRLGGHAAGVDFSIIGCGPLDGRLQRMEDRVEALGGSLQFDGNTLGGSIPIATIPSPFGGGQGGG